MKKIMIMILIMCAFSFSRVYAYMTDDVLDGDTRVEIENAFQNAGVEYDALDLIDKLNSGDFHFEYESILEYIKMTVSAEFRENLGFLSYIFVLIMLAALIENIKLAGSSDRVIKMVVLSVILLNLLKVTYDISEYSLQIIDRLMLFINSMIPTLMTLLAASGKIGTSGALNPLMLGVSSVVSTIIKSFIIPGSLVGMALRLTGDFAGKVYLTNFGNQVYKILKWVMGLMVTLYVGIISMVGVAAPKVDEITLKTTKYAVGNFIPYVGGMVADSVDLVLGCVSVVKNSVGIAGLVGILLVIAAPCLKIAVKVLCVGVLSVLISPISDKTIINSVNTVSSCLSILLGMNIVISIMYILSVTVIIFIGGA